MQCAKGYTILDLNVNEELFFTQHGITSTKNINEENGSGYLNAKIMPLGVFSVLAIRDAHFIDQRTERNDPLHYHNELEEYFDKQYEPSLESVVVQEDNNPHIRIINQPLTAFIGSWMLSSLVRYAPLKWQEILAGQETDLIKHIREFREERLIRAFDSFLPDHMR